METKTLKLYSLTYKQAKTYLFAALFIIGNILVPQLFHLLPQGGATWLPIYFFTLVGAYKYGWRMGLLTAILSPLINAFCFGMPAMAALPAILMKSTLLAIIAGTLAQRFQKVSLSLMLLAVLGYQILGTLGEWVVKGDFYLAAQDFRIGIPGMLLQIIGGYLFIQYIIRK